MNIDCTESEMYYDQSEYEQQEGGHEYTQMKTMESTTARTSAAVEKTTSKTLLSSSDILRQSGVSQKIIQKLPAYIVEQSMNKLKEEAAEQLEDVVTDELEEISMPLIQLSEIEPTVGVEVVVDDIVEHDPSLQVGVDDDVAIEQNENTVEEEKEEADSLNKNASEVPGEVVKDEESPEDKPVEIKIGRKGFLFKADALKPKTSDV